jgi:GxxExxY protein
MNSIGWALASLDAMTPSTTQRSSLPHADLTERIIGSFFEVFGELGHGFSNAVLRRAMGVALRQANLRVQEEAPISVSFRGELIGKFQADLVVERKVLVEIKPDARIESYAEAQLLNYLKAAGGGVGLLLNFGRRPEFRRMVMGDPENSLPRLSD